MTRAVANELKRIAFERKIASGNLFQRAFRRFRLPRRPRLNIEHDAAQNRAERLFEVNFRTTWTR
jgi:hypothetical protein